jgi:hypothetical protein
MRAIAFPDGSLRIEFEDWEADIGPLESDTLVPSWWPDEIDGQRLDLDERATSFSEILSGQLLAQSPRSDGVRHASDSLEPLDTVKAIIALREFFERR